MLLDHTIQPRPTRTILACNFPVPPNYFTRTHTLEEHLFLKQQYQHGKAKSEFWRCIENRREKKTKTHTLTAYNPDPTCTVRRQQYEKHSFPPLDHKNSSISQKASNRKPRDPPNSTRSSSEAHARRTETGLFVETPTSNNQPLLNTKNSKSGTRSGTQTSRSPPSR